MFRKSFSKPQIFLMLLAFVLILSRMVWIQLRTFPMAFDYRTLVVFAQTVSEQGCLQDENSEKKDSLASLTTNRISIDARYRIFSSPAMTWVALQNCLNHSLTTKTVQQMNYFFLGVTVFLSMLFVRAVTKSWVLGLFCAAMLLSRGRFLAQIGSSSSVLILELLISFMALWISYFFQTGSRLGFYGVTSLVLLGSFVDESFAFLFLAIPFCFSIWFLGRRTLRFFALKEERIQKRNRMGLDIEAEFLEPIPIPFSIWVFESKRWLRFFVPSVAGFLIAVFLWVQSKKNIWGPQTPLFFLDATWVHRWLLAFTDGLDLHFAASLVAIGMVLVTRPSRQVRFFFEVGWWILFSFLFVSLGAFLLDSHDAVILEKWQKNSATTEFYNWTRGPSVLLWFEPLILSGGIIGTIHFLNVARNYLFGVKED